MGEIVKQTEVDLAYQVLYENGQVMYFRDLIKTVLSIKKECVHAIAHSMAEVHTQINMDTRFVHMGKGMWGLTEWVPQRGVARHTEEMAAAEEGSETSLLRREKLFAEIQQDYQLGAMESKESE